jgi:hypothetical protein
MPRVRSDRYPAFLLRDVTRLLLLVAICSRSVQNYSMRCAGVTAPLFYPTSRRALPLAIGLAIASGVEPSRGLWTAIIGGFVISALGVSLVQGGGPTGAPSVVPGRG